MMSEKFTSSTPVRPSTSKDFTINMSAIKEKENVVDLPPPKPQMAFASKDYRFDIRNFRKHTKVSKNPAPVPAPPLPVNDEVKAINVIVNPVKKKSSSKDRNADKQEPDKETNTKETNLDKPEEVESIFDNIPLDLVDDKLKIEKVIPTNNLEKLTNNKNTNRPFVERNMRQNKPKNETIKKPATEKKKLKKIPEVKIVHKKNAGGKLMKYPPGATHYSMTPSAYTQVHFVHKGFVYVTIDCQNPVLYKEGEFLTIPEGSCYLIKNDSPIECQIATLN